MPDNPVLETVYDPHAVEPEVAALWEECAAFCSTPDGRSHDKTFTIVIPPPNVTGALHLGHALNNTLQDILVRYHRMRGFNTLWQPGTDHAGIATQAVVERRIRDEEGKSRHDLGREELVKRIWAWKDAYEKRIIDQLKSMGCSCDWSRVRFTLDDGLAAAVREMFFNLFRDGLIFRGKRLVNWDTQLQTAVSDDEVYHETVKGHFWHIKYPVIDPKPGEPDHVIIATTRPETMLGDTAVAVHPDPKAFFDKQEAELRSVRDRLDEGSSAKDGRDIDEKLAVLAARRESHLDQLIKLRDMARDGRMLTLPLVERRIPLIADEWADPTKGSGCVKITPAHDDNDYAVGLRHSLPMISVMTTDGKIATIVEPDGTPNRHSGTYEGLVFAGEGRQKVVTDLEARDLVHAREDRDIETGHSDRSKTEIQPFLSDQWFVKTGEAPEPRASARADSGPSNTPQTSPNSYPRTPNLAQGATLLTWTTYGSWLPGDQRGFVSRVPQAGGEHILHNAPGEPHYEDDPQLLSSALDKMKGLPVALTAEHATPIVATIAGACERHGIELLAVAVMGNHVHALCQSELHGRELLQILKGNLSRELNRRFTLGGSPRWWTKGGSRRRIKSGADLTAAIDYVKMQEHALASWSFDLDSGELVEVVESARAEARGSAHSTRPGLAQSAMDAVDDGRIKVFPPRYAKSYLDWLGEKRDWCISRQLWWGHRIPVWTSRREALPVRITELEGEWHELPIGRAAGDGTGATLDFRACRNEPSASDRAAMTSSRYVEEESVLDTWFSSALWPISTLGWPEETDHLKQYYPGSVLCTSRDIITNWVARMVMFGLYARGRIPFDHVYIHPKILDGRGETMSKSKGNGVDPVDVIHTHGADALRYSMTDMTTETQDIRMPVEYVCPHCGKLTDQPAALKAETQRRKSRGEKLDRKLQPADCPRVTCLNKPCGKEFATQWADAALKEELGFGRETSEKFDIGRNFCNKLWNAARYALMNLQGAACHTLDPAALPPEDRWILTGLSQTIRRYHECLASYQFSASVKILREFFWDSLCDWYIELTKPRLTATDDGAGASSAEAKQVLAFCLDQVLRLWHPTIPFITETIWQKLNHIAPTRGFPGVAELTTDTPLVLAPFPPLEGYPKLEDEPTAKVFAEIQEVVRAVRELRAQCDVSPRQKVTATVVLPEADKAAFEANAHIVLSMANVETLSVEPGAERPPNAGSITRGSLRVFVHDISDDQAERARTTKALAAIEKQIAGKESKLANERFIANAKPEVVEAERGRLTELIEERTSLEAHRAELGE